MLSSAAYRVKLEQFKEENGPVHGWHTNLWCVPLKKCNSLSKLFYKFLSPLWRNRVQCGYSFHDKDDNFFITKMTDNYKKKQKKQTLTFKKQLIKDNAYLRFTNLIMNPLSLIFSKLIIFHSNSFREEYRYRMWHYIHKMWRRNKSLVFLYVWT